MTAQSLALALAGLIGTYVALAHGALIGRFMVAPFRRLAAGSADVPSVFQNLIWSMLQFSAFAWGLGGLALVAAAVGLEPAARDPLALFVAALFAYGAAANFHATGGRHSGWVLMALAVGLIAFSVATGTAAKP